MALLVGPVYWSRDPQTSFFTKHLIKNGSHSTIHTFKNYFVTVFSIFSFKENKLYLNGPIIGDNLPRSQNFFCYFSKKKKKRKKRKRKNFFCYHVIMAGQSQKGEDSWDFINFLKPFPAMLFQVLAIQVKGNSLGQVYFTLFILRLRKYKTSS